MISNNDESPEEPDDDVEDPRHYSDVQRNRNFTSRVVARVSNQSNQFTLSAETSQPEVGSGEVAVAELTSGA